MPAGSTAARQMKDAATWVAGCGELRIAPRFQASTRRMGLEGERREPLHANGHGTGKAGLEPDGDQERTDRRMQEQETLAGSGIVTACAGAAPLV